MDPELLASLEGNESGTQMYGDEQVERLVASLVATGEMTYQEGMDALNNVANEGDISLVEAAGLIAGEYNIPTGKISEAAKSNGLPIMQSQIEEHKRDFVRSAADFIGGIPRAMGGAIGVMNPIVRGIDAGGQIIGDLAQGREGQFMAFMDTEDEAAEKEDRAQLRDDLRSYIDGLEGRGWITNQQATKMKSVTDNYDQGTYEDLLNEIEGIIEDRGEYADEFGNVDQSYMADLMMLDRLADRAGRIMVGQEEAPPVDMETGVPAETQAIVDSGQISHQFGDWLVSNGLVSPQEATRLAGPERSQFFDEDFIIDRYTGNPLTRDQWNYLKTNEEAAERYRQVAEMSEELTAFINTRPFTHEVEVDPYYFDAETGQYRRRTETVRRRDARYAIPIEDLNLPVPVDTGEMFTTSDSYDYMRGGGYAEWFQMSTRQRASISKLMVDQGLLTEEQMAAAGPNSVMNPLGAEIWEAATSWSNQTQMSPYDGLQWMGAQKAQQEAGRRRGGGGRSAPTYSVPASLRTIPDYKTLAQNSKQIFGTAVGRELEDWEMGILVDDLRDYHEESNRQGIAAHRAAWDDALSGGSVNVDFIEVEDPNSALSFDIEDRYSAEIDRYGRVEDAARNRRILLDSLSVGEGMI